MFYLTKRSLSQGLVTLAAFGGVALAAGSVNIPTATAQAASNFQSSCKKISIAGNTLSANCRRANGSFNKTAIRILGIHNNNGRLVFSNLNNASSFQSSCRGISVAGDTLSASCRTPNGSFSNTAIRIPGIQNNNGNLTY
ncbi:cyanovirin containing protein [Tolypothrix campylonemoides VB511288]|nr:cyanovirin containing protein [Tolypothrix campylonemoides VB511288]